MSKYTWGRDGYRCVVDRSKQALRAEVQEQANWQERPPPEVFRDQYTEGPDFEGEDFEDEDFEDGALGDELCIDVLPDGFKYAAPLHSSVNAARITSRFTPLMAMAIKAKHFDDRLYIAMEELLHDGAGEFEGLYAAFARLRGLLDEASKAGGLMNAAHYVCGGEFPESGPARLYARRYYDKFESDKKRSKPLGIYNERGPLQKIFRHDRLLQEKLEQPEAAHFRAALASDPALAATYGRYLEIVSKLTGAFAHPSVYDENADDVRLLPPSDSLENRLIKKLFGTRRIPEEFELAEELITRIRDGRLDPGPNEDDGWYAHQFFAIAALLEASSERLEIGPRYQSELETKFKALFALNRETHVKQLECPAAGAGYSITIFPEVSLEPIPEYYARVGSAYRFLLGELRELLGEAVLRSQTVLGNLCIEDGLLEMAALFEGAATASREELGFPQQLSVEERAARARFRSWQAGSASDPALLEDVRVAVPVFFDEERERVRIVATLGLETKNLEIDFVTKPDVQILGDSSEKEPYVTYNGIEHMILCPVSIECDVRVPPTRGELRAICDEHRTPEKIKEALEAR